MKASLTGFITHQLGGIFLMCIFQHHSTHSGNILGTHENQHMPVGCSVMMRLCNPDAKNTQFSAVQFGANTRPDGG
ncbi:hypothetical protein D3C75_1066760 [compost metagenome]